MLLGIERVGAWRSATRRLMEWLLTPPQPPLTAGGAVDWWEERRIPFNLIVGLWGILCLGVFLWAIESSGALAPGEDAVEPFAVILAPFAVNVLYTLGWLVEVPARLLMPGLSPRFGPRLMKLGLGFGLVLITFPAAYWAIRAVV